MSEEKLTIADAERCPFCTGEQFTIRHEIGEAFVVCETCQASGPVVKAALIEAQEAGAVKLWNQWRQ